MRMMMIMLMMMVLNKSTMLCIFEGGHGRLVIQPHRVTALAWPQSKGLVEGCLGLSVDSLLVGRQDGSIGVIEAIDSSTYCHKELRHCSRNGGYMLYFLFQYFEGVDDNKNDGSYHLLLFLFLTLAIETLRANKYYKIVLQNES
jgi:hypothetical protein